MSHFWLMPHEQAIMDRATSTAADYPCIAALDIGTAWKTAVKNLVGSEVAEQNIVRLHQLISMTKFICRLNEGQHYWVAPRKVKALVRLTANQAMMLKLRITPDDPKVMLLDDPTGESWGNLTIMNECRVGWGEDDRFRNMHSARGAITSFIRGGSLGPTLSNVDSHADVLPEEWRAAFVRYYMSGWDSAHVVTNQPSRVESTSASPTFDPMFEYVEETVGSMLAQAFHKYCQSADFRTRHGIA